VPAVQKVREAAARTQSTNNLKNIGLAFHSFHDANKRLPMNGGSATPGYSAGAASGGVTTGSWGFMILPYIDQNPMFAPGTPGSGIPATVKASGIAAYMCPGRGRPPVEKNGATDLGAWTDYFVNNFLNDPAKAHSGNNIDVKRTLVGITDGSSNTIMVGHGNISTADYSKTGPITGSANIFVGGSIWTMRSCSPAMATGSPLATPTTITAANANIRLSRDSTTAVDQGSWGGPFPQGAMMCLGDATVRLFPYSTVLGPFLTPTGGETVSLPDT
jgi:hypothetical protein